MFKRIFFIFLIILVLISLGFSISCTNKTEKILNSGIYGIITIGPITPVEKVGEINYNPYKTTIVVKSENGLEEITEFSSSEDGSFKVYLELGIYILEQQKSSNPFPILKPIKVEVEENQFSEVNISFDTGIR